MARTYNSDKKEFLQVRIPSWLKAMMQDELPAGGMSDFVRQAIEEKFSNDRHVASIHTSECVRDEESSQ